MMHRNTRITYLPKQIRHSLKSENEILFHSVTSSGDLPKLKKLIEEMFNDDHRRRLINLVTSARHGS